MRVEILSLSDPRWHDALRSLPHDTYHLPSYVALDARRMQASAEAFLASDGDRVAFVPYLRRSAALPEDASTAAIADVVSPYGYPGLLLNDAGRDASFAASVLAALKEQLASSGVCSAFLRMHPILGADLSQVFPPGTFAPPTDTVAIDLHLDERALWNQIRPGHQETLKKCQKQDFTARFVPLGDILDEFVAIYNQTMDRVKAKDTYYFTHEYFAELAEMPDTHCGIAERGGRIAAACLFFECGSIVQAHLGGTHADFLARSPFHLILYQATLWAKARGQRWLHLGGGLGGSNDKLLSFKGGFSPLRFPFLTARLITDEANYRRLVDARARALNVPADSLLASDYFPVYRSE